MNIKLTVQRERERELSSSLLGKIGERYGIVLSFSCSGSVYFSFLFLSLLILHFFEPPCAAEVIYLDLDLWELGKGDQSISQLR